MMDSTLFSFRWIVSDSHESEHNLFHNLAMNRPSNSEDHFIGEELREAPLARKAPPYHSLLSELHALIKEVQISYSWVSSVHPMIPNLDILIYLLQRELMLQQMVFMLLQNHGVTSEALDRIQTEAEKEAESIKDAAVAVSCAARPWKVRFINFRSVVSEFLETVDRKIKPHLKEACIGMVHSLLHGKHSSRDYDIFAFVHVLLLKLKDLENLKPNMFTNVRKPMETLKVILNVACILARKEANSDVDLQNFLAYTGQWVDIAAALVTLYWVDGKDEELLAIVSPSLQKFSFLALVEAYILVIKALKPSNLSQIVVMREIVRRFTNLVLENLIIHTEDGFEMLIEGLTLWISLVIDPPQADAEFEKLICAKIRLQVDKAETLIRALCLDIADRRKVLSDFLEMINEAKAALRQLHVEIPGLTLNNVPRTNGRGLFDFWLANLQKKIDQEADMFPFEKHLIETVHKELTAIRPFLMSIFELQDKHKELKDVWVRASNVAYLVNYVTDSCLSSIEVAVWSNLMQLSNAMEQIPVLKVQASEIRKNDERYHNDHAINGKLSSKLALRGKEQANATTKDEVEVGFKHEEQRIINRLIAGEAGFDFVAIVGMPGQGKTTLAKRVFQHSRIKLHFYKYAWCCITETYDTRRILLDLLENVGQQVSSNELTYLSQEDLCDRLRRCLKGQRYLVVLDDMWDPKAWHELQLSFPNDNNGSRILLTSRSRNVALGAKASFCIVELHPLSHDESWKLLRMKVFAEDFCPPALSDIGKTTAENCKGLPLSIVVVAGLLKKDKNVNSWKQISESLKEQIESEGCMDIIDLSYKHLPDFLKPCFLYLGAFPEDQRINAKKLFQFWIAEGFVKNDGMKRMEVVAEEYLMDLVDRSLVFVAQRNSRNGIKKLHVHDLLRHFCLLKPEEDRFLLMPDVSDLSSSIRCDYYRLCVDEIRVPFLHSKLIMPSLRSLLGPLGKSHFLSPAPGFLKGFKLIEVLDLSHVRVTEADFHEITQFIHLRLLAVARNRPFPIPLSIVNLLRLEVLRFLSQGVRTVLPNAVIEMKNLRHIYARSYLIEYTKYLPDLSCHTEYTEYLPDLSPPLTNLESLSHVYFSNILSFKRVAQKLPNLLKLGLTLPSCVRLSSYFMKLESLRWILRQKINVISSSNLDFPLTLKKLNLNVEDSTLSGDIMSLIGKLSNLEVLKLDANIEHGRWDVEDDEFLKLKYLQFRNANVREWNASDESFPRLEQLALYWCSKLEEIPGRFGAITTLKRIEVRGHRNHAILNSFQQIVEDQMDSGNESLQYSILQY